MAAYTIDEKQDLITIKPKDHKHTLIWIHGLAYYPKTNLNDLIEALGPLLQNVKVLIPCAPKRYVTIMDKETRSWFDIKFRGQKSFQVPFDEAFSSNEVYDSYQKVLKPMIQRQRKILNEINQKGLLVVSGFSQGCGMSLHCLYESKQVDCILGISGYLFPISKFDFECKKKKRIIYGLSDSLRPWQFTKITYDGKIPQEQIKLIPGMQHEINPNTIAEMKIFFNEIFSN